MSNYRLSDNISFQYDNMLIAESLEQIKLERYVSELIILSEGCTVRDIQALNEAEADAKKGVFTKLIEMITRLWAAFMEKVARFTKSDQGYLDKYKDIILKKKLKEDAYVLYPYWQGSDDLLGSQVPAFNFNAMKDDLVDDETFIKKYFNKFNRTKDVELADEAKAIFRGADEQASVDTVRINMSTLFNYCKDYPTLVEKVKKDLAQIKKAADEATSAISKMKPAAVTSTKESVVYSAVYQTLLTEEVGKPPLVGKVGKKEDAPAEKPAASDTTTDKTSRPKDAMNNVDSTSSAKEKEDIKSSHETSGADLDLIQRYIKICYGFLGAKMSILEEAYKAYMFIIKDHVSGYVGKGDEGNQTADQAQEYDKQGHTEAKAAVDKLGDVQAAGKQAPTVTPNKKDKGTIVADPMPKKKKKK